LVWLPGNCESESNSFTIPGQLAAAKSAKKQIVAHVRRTKIQARDRASAFGGLALQALSQTSHAWEPRQDMSKTILV